MSSFAKVQISKNINLPHFPKSIDHSTIEWQSKKGLDNRSMYRITEDGILERKQKTRREKTDKEKAEEAERWGFESWQEYVNAYEDHSPSDDSMYPPQVDYEIGSGSPRPPMALPNNMTVDEVWWGGIEKHGSFEIHSTIKRDPTAYEEIEHADGTTRKNPSGYKLDVYLQYECHFVKGTLDEITFEGERMPDRSTKETISELKNWDLNN